MSLDADTLASIDQLMARYSGPVPGASLLLRQDGVDVLVRSFGLADLETGRPATALSNYRLASLSKQFTAAAERAYGYSFIDGQWRRTDQGPTTAVLGDGGIYCSAADLSRWDAAWDDSRLLSEHSRRLATSAWTTTDDPGTAYGLGWRISGERHWHSGESLGFRNVHIRYPARRLTVAVLSNRDDPEPFPTALAIARLLVG